MVKAHRLMTLTKKKFLAIVLRTLSTLSFRQQRKGDPKSIGKSIFVHESSIRFSIFTPLDTCIYYYCSKKNISGHCPVWEEALSGVVSDDTKVSFAQKMQRRRINTILRPSHTSIIREVKKTISESRDHINVQRHYFDNDTDDEFLDPTLRAEQLLLLSLHPESPMPSLPTIPASSSANQPWAEPGWHVSVDFLPQVRNEFSILPQDAEGHLARAANSICCSTGRQVASFIKPRHLRMLTSDAPMSFVSQASAPAETHPSADDRKVSQGKTVSTLYLYTFNSSQPKPLSSFRND